MDKGGLTQAHTGPTLTDNHSTTSSAEHSTA